jgi:hypothetical protein
MPRSFVVLGTILATSIVSAASPIDCEPYRCAFQMEVNGSCMCTQDGASNHGQYVSCVAHAVKRIADRGDMPRNCKGKIKRCAARSVCGKPGFVVCNIVVPGACDLTTGTCLGDSERTCLTDAECATTRCKIKSSSDGCTNAGGTVAVGATTCCADCS